MVILRPDDFDRLFKVAKPATGSAMPLVTIAPDRFGVVPEGMAIVVQQPIPYEIKHLEFVHEAPLVPIESMRYACIAELRMPKPPMFIFCDIASDGMTERRTPREMWRATWRHGSRKRMEREQRRLDWRSNVRRMRRAREISGRS